MAKPEIVEKVAVRLGRELGQKLREFPLEVQLEKGSIRIVLRGAAGSVTALRGMREKLQPVMKKVLREAGAFPKFQTTDSNEGSDLIVQVELLTRD